jgi:hypothetical protein
MKGSRAHRFEAIVGVPSVITGNVAYRARSTPVNPAPLSSLLGLSLLSPNPTPFSSFFKLPVLMNSRTLFSGNRVARIRLAAQRQHLKCCRLSTLLPYQVTGFTRT